MVDSMMEKKVLDGHVCRRFEYHTSEGHMISTKIYGGIWNAQTFTPQEDFILCDVRLKIMKNGNPGNLYVGITGTDAKGNPLPFMLTGGSLPPEAIPTSPDYRDISFPEVKFFKGKVYAIVTSVGGGDESNFVSWSQEVHGDYPRGFEADSFDGGMTWNQTDGDKLFETWGYS